MAKDAVARTTLDSLAGGNYSLCLTRFSLGCSVFADGDGHEACNDDIYLGLFLSSEDKP